LYWRVACVIGVIVAGVVYVVGTVRVVSAFDVTGGVC
jgi:hypothetical protein